MLRVISLFLSFLFYQVSGQRIDLDTIRIDEVSIVKSRISYYAEADKTVRLDSLTINRYQAQDLGALLTKTSLIKVSSNGGAGNVATASIRGAASTHTTVNWNGIPINSLTTGVTDLSLINVGGFDKIDLVYGASGAVYGSGTMGGAINISNTPGWEKNLSIGIASEVGGYANYSDQFLSGKNKRLIKALSSFKEQLLVKASNHSVSYSGQLFVQKSKNNFKYIDIHDFGQPQEQLNHNESRVMGTIQDIHIKLNRNYFGAGVWYQVNEKQIPGKMGIGPPVSFQDQKDSLLRSYLSWKTLLGSFRLELKAAYLYDFMRFTDKESDNNGGYKIFSEISSKRWLSDFNARYYLGAKLSADMSVKYMYLNGRTNYYNKDEQEYRLSVATRYKTGNFVHSGSIGKEWNTLKDAPLTFSFSSLYNLDHWFTARVKLGNHYRRPTFNERYWEPGGNINIDAEKGESYELGLSFQGQTALHSSVTADLAFYVINNIQSIAWRPKAGELFWQPINIGRTLSKGAELELKHTFAPSAYQFDNRLSYGYNHSYNNDKNSAEYKKTIAYKPRHLIKASSNYMRNNWNIGISYAFQSSAITWENASMSSFGIVDANVGRVWQLDFLNLDTKVRIENILNKSYQIIYAYPMPGRAFYLTAIINF
ncbi:TonB-dependent Receptor Plug Domain [Saccharicrinis carchari]|uniref:TonB-dependent Receptor Plug Domain n=1 Tax=Saccharicrinis carchari TaxID=1168039 RepID=A0A521AM13_SACCC|nr:TonB-dependent receptor [Saccharicrinis carchari]SMO35832.1 TonB-dependent Receptor Plug Domain [Saccharicrinis carchari]